MFVIRQVMDMRSSPPKIMTQNWFPKNEFVKKKKKKTLFWAPVLEIVLRTSLNLLWLQNPSPFKTNFGKGKPICFVLKPRLSFSPVWLSFSSAGSSWEHSTRNTCRMFKVNFLILRWHNYSKGEITFHSPQTTFWLACHKNHDIWEEGGMCGVAANI